MFSSRFTWSMTTNSLSHVLEAQQAAGVKIIDLTQSNPTQASFQYSDTQILKAFSQPQSLLYEPASQGLLVAREAIGRYYQSRGLQTEPQNICLTASTSEGYAWLFKLLANPGDEVLIPQPGYPLFDFLTALESVKMIPYRLKYDASTGWQIDLERLAASVSTKTIAIVVVNPNNPTGSYLKESELKFFTQLCQEHGLALISDEVFSDYENNAPATAVPSLVMHQEILTFVLSGLSKISALPQMKLGWIHMNGPQSLCEEAKERLDFIADAYLSVGTPVQHAAASLLDFRHDIQSQIQARIKSNEEFLRRIAKNLRCEILRREAGWYAVIQLPEEVNEEQWVMDLLNEESVFVHPGYFYDFSQGNHIVISLLTQCDTFRNGVTKIMTRLS